MIQLVIAWTCVGIFIATAVLTLLALAGAVGRTRPPADLGKEPEPA